MQTSGSDVADKQIGRLSSVGVVGIMCRQSSNVDGKNSRTGQLRCNSRVRALVKTPRPSLCASHSHSSLLLQISLTSLVTLHVLRQPAMLSTRTSFYIASLELVA